MTSCLLELWGGDLGAKVWYLLSALPSSNVVALQVQVLLHWQLKAQKLAISSAAASGASYARAARVLAPHLATCTQASWYADTPGLYPVSQSP